MTGSGLNLPPATPEYNYEVAYNTRRELMLFIGAASGVTPGTYGDSTHVAQFTVDVFGRLTFAQDVALADTNATIDFVIDGGGAVISNGVKPYLPIKFNCTIEEVSLLGDQSGSITVDIAKCSFAQFDAGATHPVFPGDSITAADTPAIAASTKYDDALLTGWNTTINAGDILAFKVSGVTNLTKCTVSLKVQKT